jgi:hypothetical protein
MFTPSRLTLFCFVLLLVPASPALLRAQFAPPVPDELQMTSDPKAPGASAAYLEVKEIDDDTLHYQLSYARIKILTEKGKELATVEVPYGGDWKVADIRGRTVHSDGTIIPLNGKPEDLLFEKKGDLKFGRKVFTLPSVEVGSVIEYQYELRYDDDHYSSPFWNVQKAFYVHKAHYSFTPDKAFWLGSQYSGGHYLVNERGQSINSLVWWRNLPKGVEVKQDVGGHYVVDVTDIPPVPDEEYMPPEDVLLYRVFFYYMPSSDPVKFWEGESKYWLKEVDHFAEPTKTIKTAVDGIIAPTDSAQDKANKLYVAVQALDNTDYSREKSASERKELRLKAVKRAEDTLTQKSGSSEDIALLYLAMLRAAGLKAYPLKVVDRARGTFEPLYMSFSQLDDTLVVLDEGDKEIALDPGEKMCPFGKLSWRHSETKGIRDSSKGVGAMATPAQTYTDNTTSHNAELNVDPQGNFTGSSTFVMSGNSALRWRQRAIENDVSEVKKQFDQELEQAIPDGVDAHVDHFLGLDTPETNLIAVIKMKGTIGTPAGKRLLAPGFFFESRAKTPFVNQENRMEPVDMHYPERIIDQVTYHLPDGMTVEGAPQDSQEMWAGHALQVVKSQSSPGKFVIAYSVAHAFSTVKPEEYQDLRGFYQKVAAASQQQVVLTNAPVVAKGN